MYDVGLSGWGMAAVSPKVARVNDSTEYASANA